MEPYTLQIDVSSACGIFQLVFFGVLPAVTCIVGLFGNVASFIVMSKMARSSVIILLQFLCVTDNFYLVMSLLIRPVAYFSYWFDCHINAFVTKWLWPVGIVGLNLTSWLTVCITVYRYIAVCRPLQARMLTTTRRTYILMLVITCVVTVLNIPRFLEINIEVDPNTTCEVPRYTPFYHNNLYQIIYKTIIMVGLFAVIPPIVCLILTVLIITRLRKAMHDRRTYTSGNSAAAEVTSSREMRITKVSIIVVTIYIVAQTPNIVTVILRIATTIDYESKCNFYYYYINIAELLLMFNSAVNFFVYLTIDSFCKHLLRIIKCSKDKSKQSQTSQGPSTSPEETPSPVTMDTYL